MTDARPCGETIHLDDKAAGHQSAVGIAAHVYGAAFVHQPRESRHSLLSSRRYTETQPFPAPHLKGDLPVSLNRAVPVSRPQAVSGRFPFYRGGRLPIRFLAVG